MFGKNGLDDGLGSSVSVGRILPMINYGSFECAYAQTSSLASSAVAVVGVANGSASLFKGFEAVDFLVRFFKRPMNPPGDTGSLAVVGSSTGVVGLFKVCLEREK